MKRIQLNYICVSLNNWTNYYKGLIEPKPPDPKKTVKLRTRNHCKTLMNTILAMTSAPIFLHGKHIETSGNLNAYINSDGLLQSNKTPNQLLSDLKELIKNNQINDMFKSPDLAMGICDTGSSLICSPFAEDFKEGTHAPTTVK